MVEEAVKVKEATLEEAETEVVTLRRYVISEHVNSFQKALRPTKFLYKEVFISDTCFNVNLDIYDGCMVDVKKIAVAKATKRATKDAKEEKLANEGKIRVSSSTIFGHTIEHEEMENFDDGVEE